MLSLGHARTHAALPAARNRSQCGRLVAFVAGSFAAVLLAATLVDERLLERDLGGRQIVW